MKMGLKCWGISPYVGMHNIDAVKRIWNQLTPTIYLPPDDFSLVWLVQWKCENFKVTDWLTNIERWLLKNPLTDSFGQNFPFPCQGAASPPALPQAVIELASTHLFYSNHFNEVWIPSWYWTTTYLSADCPVLERDAFTVRTFPWKLSILICRT